MTPDTSEWPTVAEAARRLGLSERHARRLVDRLPDADRQKSGTSPLRVRLSALVQISEREEDEAASPAMSGGVPDESDMTADAVTRARLEERLAAAEVLIVELREDKQHLQETLAREQQNHLRLLEQIADERRDARLLHARPMSSLPSIPLDSLPDEERDSLMPESDESVPHPLPPLRRPELAPAVDPPPATWWQRMMRWVSD